MLCIIPKQGQFARTDCIRYTLIDNGEKNIKVKRKKVLENGILAKMSVPVLINSILFMIQNKRNS